MITIQELLYNRGLAENAKVKLVRHQDKRFPDLYEWYRSDRQKFLDYQNEQKKDVFKDVDYIVSFISEGSGVLSRFVGVYQKIKNANINPATGKYLYDFQKVIGFEDLEERVIINFTNPRAWFQRIKNEMEVVEIQRGLNDLIFTDYFSFILDFQQLTEIINGGYKDWKNMLSVTKGIYLITDSTTGKQYVGSAYGVDGIWGRWSEYVKTNGHGGNKSLKELIAEDKNYGKNFRFSVLMLLPSTVTNKEAIEKEQLFKKKLGTNSFGLTNN